MATCVVRRPQSRLSASLLTKPRVPIPSVQSGAESGLSGVEKPALPGKLIPTSYVQFGDTGRECTYVRRERRYVGLSGNLPQVPIHSSVQPPNEANAGCRKGRRKEGRTDGRKKARQTERERAEEVACNILCYAWIPARSSSPSWIPKIHPMAFRESTQDVSLERCSTAYP